MPLLGHVRGERQSKKAFCTVLIFYYISDGHSIRHKLANRATSTDDHDLLFELDGSQVEHH